MSEQRGKIKALFDSTLNSDEQWRLAPQDQKETIVRQLERGCFNNIIAECTAAGITRDFGNPAFLMRYSAKCANVLANMTRECVPRADLLSRILSGAVAAEGVANMTAEQLCAAASAAEREEIRVRSEQKIARKVSRMYTCRKCEGNETVHINFQAARGDEDSTISIKCVKCGHVWRM